ncbi:MAG UNVERIFIED_CONTAM: hypothetical protein LVR29_04990, partial [Microcystis novacekii LVE1205-3]
FVQLRIAYALASGRLVYNQLEEAKNFYLALGFDVSPLEPMTLMITLNDLRACICLVRYRGNMGSSTGGLPLQVRLSPE